MDGVGHGGRMMVATPVRSRRHARGGSAHGSRDEVRGRDRVRVPMMSMRQPLVSGGDRVGSRSAGRASRIREADSGGDGEPQDEERPTHVRSLVHFRSRTLSSVRHVYTPEMRRAGGVADRRRPWKGVG